MTSQPALISEIRKFFRDSDEYARIDGDTDLFREVGLDSIQLVSLIRYLEHLRRERIDPATLDSEKIRTINGIIAHYFPG